MSSNIYIYAVSERKLKSVYGIKNNALYSEVTNIYRDLLEDIDELTREELEDSDQNLSFLSSGDALKQIIFGESLDERFASIYSRVYAILCQKFSFGYFEDLIQFPKAAKGIEKIEVDEETLDMALRIKKWLKCAIIRPAGCLVGGYDL